MQHADVALRQEHPMFQGVEDKGTDVTHPSTSRHGRPVRLFAGRPFDIRFYRSAASNDLRDSAGWTDLGTGSGADSAYRLLPRGL
jgi:hypothetical protein